MNDLTIIIRYDEDSLTINRDDVNKEASKAEYEKMTTDAVKEIYPDADVIVEENPDTRTKIYGADDEDSILDNLAAATNKVFESFEWVVPATRSYTLRVRLSDTERDDLHERADEAEMSLSEYVRSVLF